MTPPTEPATLLQFLEERGIQVDEDSLSYWEGCVERRLRIPRCDDCGAWIHYPRSICPRCWSTRLTATEVAGRGTVYTYVIGPNDDETSGVMALVELPDQDGMRIAAPVVGYAPGVMEIGMEVVLDWMDFKGLPVPAFRAVTGEPS